MAQTGCEIMNCDYYVNGKCTDPNEWVNESGDPVCGLRNDAILVKKEKTMAQQTAVEWLFEQYKKHGILFSQDEEQAKEMERKQTIDAWEDGAQSEHRAHVNGKADKSSLDYYNETYGK